MKLKIPGFSRVPASLRRLIFGLGVVLLGFLVYGFCIWLTSSTPKSVDGIKDPRAFFAQYVKTAGAGDAQTMADALQLTALDSNVENFRAGAVTASNTQAMTKLPEVAPGALQDLLHGQISTKFPATWPYLISGSFIVIGNSLSDEPVVAFYNPWFDVALITKWSFKDLAGAKAGFRLMQAFPVSGRAFLENRSTLSTDKPIWSGSNALFEVRIVDAAHRFIATFEERYPPFGRDSATLLADNNAIATAVSLAENRAFSLLRWAIDAQNAAAPVNYVAGIESLRGALSASSPARLAALLPKDNPQSAETFFRLPPEIRKGMKPYLVIDRNVIFLDPQNLPTGFISAYFPPDGEGYTLGLAALFNLEASYPNH
jgi:hypothetical protein